MAQFAAREGIVRPLALLIFALLTLAAPASVSAQTTAWTDPRGLVSLDLPAGMTVRSDPSNDPRMVSLVLRNPSGQGDSGVCVLIVTPIEQATEKAPWASRVEQFLEPAFVERVVTSQGHRIVRLQAVRRFTSPAGWAGYLHVMERDNGETGVRQTAVFGAAMLAPDVRLIVQCNTLQQTPTVFTDGQVAAIVRLAASARLP